MKRLNRQARAYLLAVVRGNACIRCRCAPGDAYGPMCGPCLAKTVDDKRKALEVIE